LTDYAPLREHNQSPNVIICHIHKTLKKLTHLTRFATKHTRAPAACGGGATGMLPSGNGESVQSAQIMQPIAADGELAVQLAELVRDQDFAVSPGSLRRLTLLLRNVRASAMPMAGV
jgi:hypothetical protein